MNTSPFWYEDIAVLYAKDKLLEFYPTPMMTMEEKLNAITRLAIYSGILLSFMKNDIDYIVISVCVMLVIALFWKNQKPQAQPFSHPTNNYPALDNVQDLQDVSECTLPTNDNPFGNVLMNEYSENPNRMPACFAENVESSLNDAFMHNIVQSPVDVYNKRHNQRQFYSTANTTIPNDQNSFAQFAYGSASTCKEASENCMPVW